jgi:hypothetical protein
MAPVLANQKAVPKSRRLRSSQEGSGVSHRSGVVLSHEASAQLDHCRRADTFRSVRHFGRITLRINWLVFQLELVEKSKT